MIALVVFLVAACIVGSIATARKRDDAKADAEISEHEAWMTAMREGR